MAKTKGAVTAKKIILLGSTGSIGVQTLDIIRRHPEEFSIVALSCHRRIDLFKPQLDEWRPVAASLADESLAPPSLSGTRFFHGPEGLCRMVRETEADLVVNGLAGAAGLLPSFAALESGKDLALANKETMVMAGRLALDAARLHGRRILPVDSEHSAVFHLLDSGRERVLDEIILTASGGAFRDLPLASLARVTVEDALRHPTWKMGKKITIDSATMANKALEVIEACRFFNLPPSKIKVVIHPQSYVHALVRTIDGALYAHLSRPDMRLPIYNALAYPRLPKSDFGRLDLAGSRLEFLPVEEKRYPLLALGCRAASQGEGWEVAFNAANEVAVSGFMDGRVPYPAIERIVERTLDLGWPSLNRTLDDVILNDKTAREKAVFFLSQAR